ncbi:MAG TPA: FAD:protein FMN transferase, partial [Ohtaekwangia sp.]|uniref:FAD:protein FMN transferase n=1 Tax=Ohtaekwangia sp. TaxID=2066019 RepID=UPI002F924582
MIIPAIQEHRRQARLMGSAFEFVIAGEETQAIAAMDIAVNEVQRLEKLLTEFSHDSDTARINQSAGIQSVEVNPEVYTILQRCKHLSTLTQGAFDITAGALKKLYNFKGDRFSLPTEAALTEAKLKVGSDKVILQPENKVYLQTPGMHISFAAIGKGYAADRVKALLMKQGIDRGVINASGDLTAWGTRADGTPWKVGIADPQDSSRILAWIPV